VNITELRKHFQRWCSAEGHEKMAKISAISFWTGLKRVLSNEGMTFEKAKNGKDNGKTYLFGIKVKGLNDRERKNDSASWGNVDDLIRDNS
jgi:hypothetical protein